MAFWVSKRCYCCRAASLISSHCKWNMNRVAFEFDQRWCSFQWFRFSKGLWLTPFIFFPRTDIHTVWTHCTHRSHDATSKTDIASHVPKTTFRILFLLWIFDHKCLLEVSHRRILLFCCSKWVIQSIQIQTNMAIISGTNCNQLVLILF